MNRAATIVMVIVMTTASLGAGYWLGTRQMSTPSATPDAVKKERKILYYRNPMGQPDTSTVPKKDEMGMDYIPVYEDEAESKKERKILYYRNPMGQPDTSTVPKKDEMGMDYIPVYEDEESGNPDAARQVKISSEKIQKLGVRTEAAAQRELSRIVHAVGRVEANERLTYTISPKFEGWIERLHVNTTGAVVGRGQPLLEVYSPELVSAQKEYAIAVQGQQALANASPEARAGMKQLADASLARMKNWDISAEQLKALSQSPEARHTLTYRSPVNGIVMEKKAVQGMRFMPGDVLYQIADLSSIWVLADVFEQDLSMVRTGQAAKVRFNAYPGKEFEAKLTYVYPTLNAQTRTVPVRLEMANPGMLLKPAMYADVELSVPSKGKVLTIPASAVIYGGKSQSVLVELAEGRFEPRDVRLGSQGNDYVEVLEGLGEGEKVVVSANFLIDSESNLKAAFSSLVSKQPKPEAAADSAHKEQ
ncbi:MAG: efflux RND transporter periplasmic adaptor subunit [Sulfurimicrobium sp.]|nr:efflux RND transporter periplasmic adaptor subunit [Sulfurimicrobium sp.]MDP2199306.1 efflux RND transporter periplasmic adaptor subunit [Sulfurimicrobium sp.]